MSNFHANLSAGRLPAPHGSPSELICIKGRISLDFEFQFPSLGSSHGRMFRHFQHIKLLTFWPNLICQEFPKVIVSDYLFIKSQTSIIQTKTSYCSDSFFFINGNKKEVPDFCCFTTIVIHFIPPEEGHKKLPRLVTRAAASALRSLAKIF